jgi:CheY-like chemotaxis protein
MRAVAVRRSPLIPYRSISDLPMTSVNRRAKVIMITAMVDEAVKEAAVAAGAFGFVQKPAAPDALIATIKQAWLETT